MQKKESLAVLNKKRNWIHLLSEEINRSLTRPFVWGEFDCALAACNFIYEQTGVDPAAAYRGKYATKAEANALIDNDLGKFAAGIAASLSMEEVGPLHAHRGDLVLVDNGTSRQRSVALGIVDLSGQFALCAGPQGLMWVKMHRWKRAWRVG